MEKRADPDALLAGMRQANNGRLTVFLGAAAGVGKTYAMLEAAHERLLEGADVVGAWVEAHGRKETEGLLAEIDMITPRQLEYRGKVFAEMDLDAVLDRHPQLVMVDELAHSNIAGSRHIKRYQDVEEILAAGIDVYTTINIQHLESLNDLVAQITGIKVRETVPDKVLERAEIKLVDIPPEELIQRLNEGKIYLPDQAAEAVKKFFRPGNINALREMALRLTARRVDQQLQDYMRAHAIDGPWPTGEKIMVCISSSPLAARLIRVGQRMANNMKSDWLVVYVDQPGTLPITGRDKDRLQENLRRAEELGAETINASGSSTAQVLVQLAVERNIGHIIMGKPLRPRWQELLRGSVVDEVIRQSEGISVHVISGKSKPDEVAGQTRRTVNPVRYRPYLFIGIILAVLTLILYPFSEKLGLTNIAMLYLLPVLLAAVIWSREAAVLAALISDLAFDFFFIPPFRNISVSDIRYLLTFCIMLVVAWVTGSLSDRLRQQIRHAQQRENSMALLYSLSRELTATSSLEEVLRVIIKNNNAATGGETIILMPDKNGNLVCQAGSLGGLDISLSPNEAAVATWAFQHGQAAGRGTTTVPGSELVYIPLISIKGPTGVMGIKPGSNDHGFWIEFGKTIESFANITAMAINRVQLAEEARLTP